MSAIKPGTPCYVRGVREEDDCSALNGRIVTAEYLLPPAITEVPTIHGVPLAAYGPVREPHWWCSAREPLPVPADLFVFPDPKPRPMMAVARPIAQKYLVPLTGPGLPDEAVDEKISSPNVLTPV